MVTILICYSRSEVFIFRTILNRILGIQQISTLSKNLNKLQFNRASISESVSFPSPQMSKCLCVYAT
jgi:hypothetical protein